MTEIEWKDLLHSRSYLVKDYADLPNKREAIVISPPFHSDVKFLFDFFTQDVIVDSLGDDGSCTVVRGRPGYTHTYQNHFWLTSFDTLFRQFIGSQDFWGLKLNDNDMACLIGCNTSYCLDLSVQIHWMSPYQPPNSMVPIRVQYWGRETNGSQVTEYSVVGDLNQFQRSPTMAPDIFAVSQHPRMLGIFARANEPSTFFISFLSISIRTGESMRFPTFPDRFSLLMEKVDVDFKRIVYEELWYDRTLKMVRWDNKPALGRDDDPLTYIFDFNFGVKYIIDRHLMHCDPYTPIVQGDDFTTVSSNGTLEMITAAAYFHAELTDIQYAGQATVRDVLCDTWVGQYFDRDANRIVTVQWYFTVREWMEAVGSVEGAGAFFRMEIWNGGSRNPDIYNVLRYNPSPPDIDDFDFSECYGFHQKKHFTAEFKVLNAAKFPLLSRRYLKQQVVTQMASRLQIQPNRFTDITFDFGGDGGNGTGVLYMTGTLLDRATANGKPLQGVFDFMVGSIAASHFQIFLADPQEETQCSCPAPTPCPTQNVTCPQTPCPCTTPAGPSDCPPPVPCSTPSTTPCSCPSVQTPCQGMQAQETVSTGVSVGALVGGLIGTLLLGLIIGFVVTRFYHVLRVDRNPMTINLMDNDRY
ncbi:hypothetical protein BaRGS_00017327 [Batillaria attramentaria]|uniref:LolA-like domain-containing protein n=1 Tax=Batillaria attramentaria TaxID=370345 RepID=A0ABD0KW21_9CAEN